MIENLIREHYENRENWFVEEVNQVHNMQRVNEIIGIKEYLEGKHSILNKPSFQFNGKTYEPKKIVLNYAKTMLNFSVGYLLSNPITLTGAKSVVDEYKRIYKRGKYNSIDYDLLDKMSKYGFVVEVLYFDGNNNIRSKVLDPVDCFPVYDHQNNYVALIEYFCIDNIDYFTAYYPDKVEEWSNKGGQLRLINSSTNIAGLPIIYKNQSEINNFGRSDLKDILPILDNMESLLSKAYEAYETYITGIPTITGQFLKGEGLPKEVVSGGLVLEETAKFEFVSNSFDHQAFESIYKTLSSALLDISNVPAVSMSKTDISNLSEVSIRLLFSLSDMKGALNAKFMREGMEQRFDVIRKMLGYKGISFSDDDYDTLGIVFQLARPSNNKEIVENLKTLYSDMGSMSLETVLSINPYITDVQGELQKINSTNKEVDNSNNGIEVVDDVV